MRGLPRERSECFGYQSRIDSRVTVIPRSAKSVLDIAVAEVEPVVKPDGVKDHVWRESAAFAGIHGPILPILAL